jgi:transposase
MRIPKPTKTDLEKTLETRNISQTAEHYGVHPATVTNWRHQYGIERKSRIKKVTVDSLVAEGKSTPEIRAIFPCSRSYISERRRALGIQRKCKPYQGRTVPADTDEPRVAFIPPQDRLMRALRVKARLIGKPLEWIRDVWLRGQGGREFLREQP